MQFNMQLNGIILFSYLLNPMDSLINLHQNTSENWLCGSDGWLGNVIELSVFFMVVALTYVACELTSALSGVFGFLCSVARQNLNTQLKQVLASVSCCRCSSRVYHRSSDDSPCFLESCGFLTQMSLWRQWWCGAWGHLRVATQPQTVKRTEIEKKKKKQKNNQENKNQQK